MYGLWALARIDQIKPSCLFSMDSFSKNMTFQVKWLTYMAGYLLPSMVFQHFGRGAKTRRLTNQTATSECLGASILWLVHGSHFQPTCWATRGYIKWNLKCWRVICLDNCDHPSMWTFNYCCTASGMAPSTCSFVNDWASWSELYLWLKVDVRSILMRDHSTSKSSSSVSTQKHLHTCSVIHFSCLFLAFDKSCSNRKGDGKFENFRWENWSWQDPNKIQGGSPPSPVC